MGTFLSPKDITRNFKNVMNSGLDMDYGGCIGWAALDRAVQHMFGILDW
jgi:hypothetical protein